MTRLALFVVIICGAAELFFFGFELAGHLFLSVGLSDAAAYCFRDPSWRGVSLYAAGRWNEAAESFALDESNSYNLGNALVRAGRYHEAIESYDRALATDPDDTDAAMNKALVEAGLQHADKVGSGRHGGSLSASPAIKVGGSRDRPPIDGGAGGSGEGLASGNQTQGPVSAGGRVTKDGEQSARLTDPHQGASAGAVGAFGGAGRSGEVQPNFPDLLQERQSRMRRRQQEANVHPSLEWLATLSDDPGLYLKAKILAEKARRLKAAGGPIPEDD